MEAKPSFGMDLLKLWSRIVLVWVTITALLAATIVAGSLVFVALEPLSTDPILNSEHVFGTDFSDHQLLSLRISGVIDGQAPDDPLERIPGLVYGYDITTQLDLAAENDQVAGVILEIDSPGGTIYGAQAIAEGVKRYKDKTKKPVYAHVSGLAASGGYWAAASTDRIIADLGSSIGSIGVTAGPFYFYDKVLSTDDDPAGTIVTQNGIQSVTITAGKGKSMGDPYRRLTAEETANLQEGVNNDYAAFVKYVSERRTIPADVVRNQIGALIFGTQAATTYKLIDATGGRESAYAELAAAADLKEGEYEVVRPGLVSAAPADSGMVAQVASFLHPRRAAPAQKSPAPKACVALVSRALYGDPTAHCAK